MKAVPFRDRLAVCSWSLQPNSPEELVEKLKVIGLPRVQVALEPLRADPRVWSRLPDLCQKNGIQMVSGMMATVGEDYSTLESIRRTGGVLPDETWEQNWKNIQEIVMIARAIGLRLISFHAGFLPHEESDPMFPKLLDRVRKIADIFGAHRLELAFETGQETAKTLTIFLRKLARSNVGVNFDPANILLYDQGDPIEALRILGPWLRQCHIKDAVRTKTPGTWGEEVPAGTGEVNWAEFFRMLTQVSFGGYCSIEREAGNQRVEDIKTARQMIERMGI